MVWDVVHLSSRRHCTVVRCVTIPPTTGWLWRMDWQGRGLGLAFLLGFLSFRRRRLGGGFNVVRRRGSCGGCGTWSFWRSNRGRFPMFRRRLRCGLPCRGIYATLGQQVPQVPVVAWMRFPFVAAVWMTGADFQILGERPLL